MKNLTPTQKAYIRLLRNLNTFLLAEIEFSKSLYDKSENTSDFYQDTLIKLKLLDIEVHNIVIKRIESGELTLEEELKVESIKLKGEKIDSK